MLVNTISLWYEIYKSFNEKLTWKRFEEMSHGNFIEKQNEEIEQGENFWNQKEAERIYNDTIHVTVSIGDILHDAVLSLSSNYILTIVSSGSEHIIRNFIKKENLDGCFVDILGYEIHKKKTVKINSLLEKYNLQPNYAVFITDTLGDVREANECGVPSIGVTWGLHDRQTLEKGNPKAVIDNPPELLGTIERILC